MKKFLATICAATILLTGCGDEAPNPEEQQAPATRVKAVKVL